MRMYLWATVLVFGIKLASATDDQLMCGVPPQRYQIYEKLCCNKTIYDRYNADREELGCCERQDNPAVAERYLKASQVCCNGKVYQQTSRIRECCGNSELYYADEKVCCGNQLYNKKDTPEWNCCGSQMYNMSKYGCCINEVTGKYRFTSVMGPNDRCCGDQKFDINHQTCDVTNYTLRMLQKPVCNNVPYNHMEKVCCNEKWLVPIPSPSSTMDSLDLCNESAPEEAETQKKVKRHLTPCGNDNFDPNSKTQQEFCCNGVKQTAEFGKGVYCCGTRLIDTNEKCCDHQVLAPDQTCCGNKLYSIKDMHDNKKGCCNDEVISKEEHLCCKLQSSVSKKIKKHNYTDNECCTHRNGHGQITETYNSFEKVCTYERGIKPATDSPRDRRIIRPPKCPFCGSRKKVAIKDSCNAENYYRMWINDEEVSANGTRIKGTIFGPQYMKDTPITIDMPYRCRCLKPGKRTSLFTDRHLSTRVVNIKMSTNDHLLPNGRSVRKIRNAVCAIKTKLRPDGKKRTRKNRRKAKSGRTGTKRNKQRRQRQRKARKAHKSITGLS